MNSVIPNDGFNLAMEMVHTFPPKYWKKTVYGNKQYVVKFVDYDSNEFCEIMEEVGEAQLLHGVRYTDGISEIHRIQNPYTYARFILRKKHMKLANGCVYQNRKYKLIPKKYLDQALKYNCDGRKLGKADGDYIFYAGVPNVWDKYVLIMVQVLTSDEDEEEEDIECERDSEFYIEYVVYFENY